MPQTYFNTTKSGIEYKYQTINGIPNLVFASKDDCLNYHSENHEPTPLFDDNWRYAIIGKWVVADDKGVVQILRKKEMNHPRDHTYANGGKYAKNGYCGTVVGTFLCNDNKLMDTDFNKHPDRYSFKTSPRTVEENILHREKMTDKERQFAYLTVASNLSMEAMVAIYKAIWKTETTNDKHLKKRIRTILQRKDVMRIIAEGVADMAERIGITKEFTLQGIFDLAGGANREDVRLSALKECSLISGVELEVSNLSGNMPNNGQLGSFDEPQSLKDGTPSIQELMAPQIETAVTEEIPDAPSEEDEFIA